MKIRTLVAVAAMAAAVAVNALALSAKYADFGKGPEQFLMTKDEQAQWKNVKTDADAQAFIDTFWLRRDPTPGTPRNEFHENFDIAVKYADEHFTSGRRRGSLTDRGKVLILFGPPVSAAVSGDPGVGFGLSDDDPSGARPKRMVWTYEGSATSPISTQRTNVAFVDAFSSGEYTLERGSFDFAAAQQRAIAAAIRQPNAVLQAPVVLAPAPPVAVLTSFKTPAYRAAVEQFKAAKSNPYKSVAITWGEFVTATGEAYVPVALYVPRALGLTAANDLTFFGIIQDPAANPVAVLEEPARLSETKGDYYYDRSLTLPAGKYSGIFGLAENGKPLAMAAVDLTIAEPPAKDAPGVSGLLLSNNVFPMTKAQNATDPFAFGGVKVVPKADKTFHKGDELWYFCELRNPGINDLGEPKIQLRVDVEGQGTDGKKFTRVSPLSEVQANPLKGVPGHFGVGSAIPLESFPPGDYTLRIKVSDTVRKTSYNLQDNFKIVGEGK
jgi:GWxTD domain-containing protein